MIMFAWSINLPKPFLGWKYMESPLKFVVQHYQLF